MPAFWSQQKSTKKKRYKGLVWTSRGRELWYQQEGLLRDVRDVQSAEMQLPLPMSQIESRMGANMGI